MNTNNKQQKTTQQQTAMTMKNGNKDIFLIFFEKDIRFTSPVLNQQTYTPTKYIFFKS